MRYTVAGKDGASRMDTETGCRGAMSLNCPKCGIGLLDPNDYGNVVWACQSTPHSQSSECRISVLIKIRGELVEALEEMIRAEKLQSGGYACNKRSHGRHGTRGVD
jgi:hypothetical protein